MNIPEYYDDMSLRLMEVLDSSGLKEDLRWQRINTWLQIEDLERMRLQIVTKTDIQVCTFGSQAEGTTTDGLLSDIDQVLFLKSEVALEDLQSWEASLDTDDTFLMVADESTPPGYVKLQLVQRDAPILVNNYQDDRIRLDSKHRSVLCNNTIFTKVQFANKFHGPACRFLNKAFDIDTVAGLRTHGWPYQASQWISSRRRHFNWPPRQIIDVIQESGAFLVPVGHTLSLEQHLEWRLSFSFGEKLLTWKFNSTQYKCYVMLKFIKNTFINVGGREYLSSYHFKTCMFYLIENAPDSLWHPHNLLFCIDLCLRLLLSWIECRNCPNYFIPDENMFLGRIVGSVQGHIAGILHGLLMQKGRYITRIPYQSIGENVCRMSMSLPTKPNLSNVIAFSTTFAFLAFELDLLCISVVNIMCNLNVLKSSHSSRQEVVNIVRSLFCSSIGNHLASQSLEQEIPNKEQLIMAHELLLWGSSSDVASGNLKLAAFYLSQSNLDAMEEVLNHIDAKLTHTVFDNGALVLDESRLSQIPREDFSVAKLVQHSFAFNVYYGPMDIHIIPKVLTFEMFRSTASEPVAEPVVSHWIPIAVLRPSLYLYFLQYQCFHLQGRVARSSVALNNMIWIYTQELDRLMNFMTDDFSKPYLSQLRLLCSSNATTALNLIAYCLIQGRRLMDGFKVLCKSMKLKNQHNAAKWQIATFIISMVRNSNFRPR